VTLRTSRKGAAIVRVEVLPPDELPAGVPQASAGPCEPEPAGERDERGRFRTGARTQQARGGRAVAAQRESVAMLRGLGLRDAQPAALAPYLSDAQAFSEAERARLARAVGGGICEGSAALLVDAGALATAASRAAYAAGDAALGARLSAEARSNLLGAHELCAREAQRRPKRPGPYVPAWFDGAPAVSTPAQESPMQRVARLAAEKKQDP
jgi:hypothetical protein